eukprot:1518268-Ditylum_brightwellii.AAC.1
MADSKQTASWRKKWQKPITSAGMIVMMTRGESKQKKDGPRKSSREQHSANETELDDGHRPL